MSGRIGLLEGGEVVIIKPINPPSAEKVRAMRLQNAYGSISDEAMARHPIMRIGTLVYVGRNARKR